MSISAKHYAILMDGSNAPSNAPPNAPLATIPAPIMPQDFPFLPLGTFFGVLHNFTVCTPTSGHPRNSMFTHPIVELSNIILISLTQIIKDGIRAIQYGVSETEK